MWIRVYRDLVFCDREDIVEVEYLGYWFYLTMKACPGMWEKPGDELEGGVIKNWISLERMSIGTQKRLIREVEIKNPTLQQIYRVLFYGIINCTEQSHSGESYQRR